MNYFLPSSKRDGPLLIQHSGIPRKLPDAELTPACTDVMLKLTSPLNDVRKVPPLGDCASTMVWYANCSMDEGMTQMSELTSCTCSSTLAPIPEQFFRD